MVRWWIGVRKTISLLIPIPSLPNFSLWLNLSLTSETPGSGLSTGTFSLRRRTVGRGNGICGECGWQDDGYPEKGDHTGLERSLSLSPPGTGSSFYLYFDHPVR